MLLILPLRCIAHLKWVSVTEPWQQKKLKIQASEGITPFTESRKFFIDRIFVSNSTGYTELKRSDFEITNNNSSYFISFPAGNTENSRIVIESGPVFKQGFSNSRKTKPDRVEFSRLVTYNCSTCSIVAAQPKNSHLDIVPLSPFSLKVGSTFQFRVLHSGQCSQKSYPILYKSGINKPIPIDMSSGVGKFKFDQAGKYYVAVQHTQKIDGFFKYPQARELHLLVALTLDVL